MRPARGLRLRAAVAAVGLLAFAGAAAGIPVRAAHGAQTTADEPQYLLTAISLAEDHDLDVADELAAGRWRAFHAAPLPEQTRPLPSGRRLSPHDPLLPLLLALPVALGGWVGAKLAMAALAGLLAGLLLWTAVLAAGAGAAVLAGGANRGLGAAVRAGLAWAVRRGAAAVAFCDADGEYDPRELERLVAPILEGRADYVVGSRFAGRIDRMLPHRRAGNRLLTRLLGFIARAPIGDGQSGFRALSWAAAADAEVVHDYNYAQVLTLDLLAKGYRYLEVPIAYRFRTAGRSFVRPLTYLRRVAPAVWRELNPPAPAATPEPGFRLHGAAVGDDLGTI